MYLSLIDMIDLFLRFLAVGQLTLLSIYILTKPLNQISILAVSVNLCLASYVLLTAPIPNDYYGIIRGILLFSTDITPYLLWLLTLSLFKDNFQPMQWPLWIKSIITLSVIWFLYFFVYNSGEGVFHQINHLVGLFVILHIIFVIINEFSDDLVAVRRNARVITVIYICVYLIFIILLELGDAELRDSMVFSLLNATVVLISVSFFSWYYFKGKFTEQTKIITTKKNSQNSPVLPLNFKAMNDELEQLMLDGVYTETQLSIKQLANMLKIPEHQLRELINKHLGFRNFTGFLNSYRIPAACQQLESITYIRKPILTIALELGYGSIATFNRTFKAIKGITPKEYRNKFQK